MRRVLPHVRGWAQAGAGEGDVTERARRADGAGAIDWPALMRLGLHELRLTPEAFWQLTPWELRMMAGDAGGAGAGFERRRFAALEALVKTRHGATGKGDGRRSGVRG